MDILYIILIMVTIIFFIIHTHDFCKNINEKDLFESLYNGFGMVVTLLLWMIYTR